MHVADQLLRDGAGASRVAADGVLQRAGDPDEVDAIVLVEPLVLDRDEGLRNVSRKRRKGHVGPELDPDLTDEGTVAGEDHRRLRRADDPPCLGAVGARRRRLRLKWRADHRAGGKGDDQDPAETHERERDVGDSERVEMYPCQGRRSPAGRPCDPAHRPVRRVAGCRRHGRAIGRPPSTQCQFQQWAPARSTDNTASFGCCRWLVRPTGSARCPAR